MKQMATFFNPGSEHAHQRIPVGRSPNTADLRAGDNTFTALNLSSGGLGQQHQNSTQRQQQNCSRALMELGKLSTSLRSERDGQSAHKLSDRLVTVITSLRRSSPGCPLHNHSEHQWVILKQSLKDCARIAINSVPPTLRQMKVVRVHRERDSHELEQGELAMTTITLYSHDEGGNEVVQSLSALRFRPSSSKTGSPFVAFFWRTN